MPPWSFTTRKYAESTDPTARFMSPIEVNGARIVPTTIRRSVIPGSASRPSLFQEPDEVIEILSS